MITTRCTYPVVSKLASAAKPKECKRLGGILTNVPYINENTGEMQSRAQSICFEHACEVATWRFAYSLPQHQFTKEEFEYMVAAGAHGKALAIELKALGQFEPGDEEVEISE